MSTRARFTSTAVLLTAALAAVLSSPPVAAADGLPVVGIDARPVSAPGGKLAYVTRRAGRATALAWSTRTASGGSSACCGDFSFDAISPDGRTLYLIHYPTPRTSSATRCAPTTCARGGCCRSRSLIRASPASA